jgi:hypothetical protein
MQIEKINELANTQRNIRKKNVTILVNIKRAVRRFSKESPVSEMILIRKLANNYVENIEQQKSLGKSINLLFNEDEVY